MSGQSPGDLGILQLIDAKLSSESTVWLIKNVLCSNSDFGVCLAAGEEKVDGRRRDNHFGVGVELSIVEVGNDVGN